MTPLKFHNCNDLPLMQLRNDFSEITPHLVSSTRKDKAIVMTNEYELVLTSYTFVFIRIHNCVIA
jgi:hypothetical protein